MITFSRDVLYTPLLPIKRWHLSHGPRVDVVIVCVCVYGEGKCYSLCGWETETVCVCEWVRQAPLCVCVWVSEASTIVCVCVLKPQTGPSSGAWEAVKNWLIWVTDWIKEEQTEGWRMALADKKPCSGASRSIIPGWHAQIEAVSSRGGHIDLLLLHINIPLTHSHTHTHNPQHWGGQVKPRTIWSQTTPHTLFLILRALGQTLSLSPWPDKGERREEARRTEMGWVGCEDQALSSHRKRSACGITARLPLFAFLSCWSLSAQTLADTDTETAVLIRPFAEEGPGQWETGWGGLRDW